MRPGCFAAYLAREMSTTLPKSRRPTPRVRLFCLLSLLAGRA